MAWVSTWPGAPLYRLLPSLAAHSSPNPNSVPLAPATRSRWHRRRSFPTGSGELCRRCGVQSNNRCLLLLLTTGIPLPWLQLLKLPWTLACWACSDAIPSCVLLGFVHPLDIVEHARCYQPWLGTVRAPLVLPVPSPVVHAAVVSPTLLLPSAASATR
jgi:hypothetical protein